MDDVNMKLAVRCSIGPDTAGSPRSAVRLSPSPKRSRRSVQKRVVSIPIVEAEGLRAKGASETAPPSDSWAWRKYGQKPIKGSPYPRGYYRCSSSKGCPARKQVERSQVDPTMLVVTYSFEHSHSSPLPRSSQNSRSAPATAKGEPDPDADPIRQDSPPESEPADPEPGDGFSDFIGDEHTLMAMPADFWSSTSSLYGPIFGGGELGLDDCAEGGGVAGDGGEDDGLFDGLGELPEYSVVFRRSYLDRQMAAG